MIILINGIPASGKTTLAQKLHLALEHLGYQTILLDDEVIKRLSTDKINTLVDFLEAPVTIIASTNPDIHADTVFWLDTPIAKCERRNNERLEREHAPKLGNMQDWQGYYSPGEKIKTLEEMCIALNKKNLTC